ncbi:hypothetical protein P22_0212 [Propionispora sp. 2/2-37]|uniref:histidine triad nucleotide-binding protein n=1 Tax=Propionispora sp. 2/2-37 TaxID=1677858 RepID=UPI0006BB64BD|nr:histidine triad nucleotide-binding protein [Propionispora sp. 2/2-37]CUH94150.1 hypothetical protein P22_0212 [Propionispora sp. 2/2-37]
MQNECIFCKIATKQIPVEPIYEDEQVIAFPDINPAAPVHVLLIPKMHIDHLLAVKPQDSAILARLSAAIPKIAAKLGLTDDGFRVVINTKKNGGQTVHHLHYHILGGRSMNWPPG